MGCCHDSEHRSNAESLKQQVYESMQQGNLQKTSLSLARLKQVLPRGQADIDSLTFLLDPKKSIELNCLGLSLALGKCNIFKYIHQKLNADPLVMEEYLIKSKLTGLYIICSQNYLELFDYYLEIYLKIKLMVKGRDSSRFSMSSQDSFKRAQLDYTPIQVACYMGNIPIIKFALEYCRLNKTLPEELDLNHTNEKTGENCALIACRGGNLNTIKYLHQKTYANFHTKNFFNENALQVLAASARARFLIDFHKSFVYLIEKVRIDLSWNYQEILLLLDNNAVCDYFLAELAKLSIFLDKKVIEQEVMVRPKPPEDLHRYDTGENFDLMKIFPDLLRPNSVMSYGSSKTSFFSCGSK